MSWPIFEFFGNYFIWTILTAAIVVSMVALVENDEPGKATIELVVTLLFLQFLTTAQPFNYIYDHPLQILLYFVIYIAVGAIWGWCRWGLFVHAIADKYSDFRIEYMKRMGKSVDSMTSAERKNMLTSARAEFEFDIPCVVSQHKSRITTWMTYWPFSALWTIANDPVRRIYRWILAHMHGMLQSLSTRAFSNYRNDFE